VAHVSGRPPVVARRALRRISTAAGHERHDGWSGASTAVRCRASSRRGSRSA